MSHSSKNRMQIAVDFFDSSRISYFLTLPILLLAVWHAVPLYQFMATSSLWQDELVTVEFFSSLGWHNAVTNYGAPNNHVFLISSTPSLRRERILFYPDVPAFGVSWPPPLPWARCMFVLPAIANGGLAPSSSGGLCSTKAYCSSAFRPGATDSPFWQPHFPVGWHKITFARPANRGPRCLRSG